MQDTPPVRGGTPLWLRKAAVYGLRFLPLPWRRKRWIVWFLGPRFGLGVHAVITNLGGEVLSLRSAYAGRWQLPGGGVKYGETLDEAMNRELLEEVGLRPAKLVHAGTFHDVAIRGVSAVYRVTLAPGDIRLSEEHTAWRYAPIADLPPFYRRCAELALSPSADDG